MAVWIAHRPHGPRADRFFQTGAAVLTDAPSPIELVAQHRIDVPTSAETLATAVADVPVSGEWFSGTLRIASAPGEALGAVFTALWPPLEAISSITLLKADQYGALEWIGILRRDDIASAEALVSLVLDGDPPFEWLSTGTIVVADSGFVVEGVEIASGILVSVETGPNRARLLASPGRIRLLRRN